MARFTIDIPDELLLNSIGQPTLFPQDEVLHALTAALAHENTRSHCVWSHQGTVRHHRLGITVSRLRSESLLG